MKTTVDNARNASNHERRSHAQRLGCRDFIDEADGISGNVTIAENARISGAGFGSGAVPADILDD